MSTKLKKKQKRVVAIEVCHSQLHMAVREIGGRGQVLLHTDSIVWRKEASSIHSATGSEEVTAALRELVTRHRLTGLSLDMTLSGDYCVTRVVTGPTERVRQELHQLEQRSHLYLWLGHGPKALAASVRQIDARHQHALLTVVNQRTRDTLLEVAQRVGLQLRLIEPSLVSLSRLIGQMQGDDENPALIVSIGEQGVELGITHHGQLLLDYRPSSLESRTEVAGTIQRHLTRLQRYCGRYVGFAKGNLKRLFLCGEPVAVAAVIKELASHDLFQAQILNLNEVDSNWEFPGESPGPDLCPAVGTTLLAQMGSEQSSGPNLIERLRSTSSQSLPRALISSLWPLAAVLLLTITAWGWVFYERGLRDQLQTELDQYESVQRETRLLTGGMLRDRILIELLREIEVTVQPFHWQPLTAAISNCLPEDVWLEGISTDGEGRLQLQGSAYTEDGVFEFVNWLKKLPFLENVALGATQPVRFQSGPATRFTVHCGVTDLNDERGEKSRES